MSGFAVGVVLGLILIGALPIPGASWLARALPIYQVCISSAQRNCVVDGDTIRQNGETVGLEDIEAPKVGKPKCLSELGLGKRTKLRLVELVNEEPFDVTRSGDRDIDQDGRQLRTLLRNGHSLLGLAVGIIGANKEASSVCKVYVRPNNGPPERHGRGTTS
jgi:endonuclease YncB( thermonuclease family)